MSLSSESSCTPNGANANCSPAVTKSLMFIREPSWSWILDCRLWAVDCGFWTVDSEVVCWTDQDTDCGLLMFSKHPAVSHSWTSGSTFTCSWLVTKIHVYVFDTFFLKTEQNKRFDVLPLNITAFFPFLSFPSLPSFSCLLCFLSSLPHSSIVFLTRPHSPLWFIRAVWIFTLSHLTFLLSDCDEEIRPVCLDGEHSSPYFTSSSPLCSPMLLFCVLQIFIKNKQFSVLHTSWGPYGTKRM